MFFVLFCFVFWDRVSLCSPGCPGTHFVDQAGLELRNPPASASQVLGLKACATTAWLIFFFFWNRVSWYDHRSASNSLCSQEWPWSYLPTLPSRTPEWRACITMPSLFSTGDGTYSLIHSQQALPLPFMPSPSSKNWSSKILGDSQIYRLTWWTGHACLHESKQKPTVPVIVLSLCAPWLFTV
jgi:hypothetical protein